MGIGLTELNMKYSPPSQLDIPRNIEIDGQFDKARKVKLTFREALPLALELLRNQNTVFF